MQPPLAAQSIDRSVLDRIAGGDLAAINECISQYGGLIWSLARRLTRTPADAEDATQEIFVNVWSSATAFDSAKGSETVFIAVIARRRLIDELLIDTSVDVMEVEDLTDSGTSPQTHVEVTGRNEGPSAIAP
jgi:RNA polymerase sigma factor (sigma-70 family)